MKRLFYFLVLFLAICAPISARQKIFGYAEKGGKTIKTSPATSYVVQESYPLSTVTIYEAGTLTLADIYSNNSGTIKSNPFTSDLTGYFEFYVNNGCYDEKFSGVGITTPFTISNICTASVTAEDSKSYASLSDAISQIGLNNVTLNISDVNFPLGDSVVTVPSNIYITFTFASSIDLASGTLNLPEFYAPRKTIFSGSGIVNLIAPIPEKVYPEWWGAIPGDNISDQVPVQKAIDTVFNAKGGNIVFSGSNYKVNGSFDSTTNSLLRAPTNLDATSPITIALIGECLNRVSDLSSATRTCTNIDGSGVTGSGDFPSLFAAAAFAPPTSFNYVSIVVKNIRFIAESNGVAPTKGLLNLHNAITADVEDVMLDPGTNYGFLPQPVVIETALITPATNNYAESYIKNVSIFGFNVGIRFSEHTVFAGRIGVSKCNIPLYPEQGYHNIKGTITVQANPIIIENFSERANLNINLDVERFDTVCASGCSYTASVYSALGGGAPSGTSPVWYQSSPGNDIHGTNLTGKIEYSLTITNSGYTNLDLSNTGVYGNNRLEVVNIQKPRNHDSPSFLVDTINQNPYMAFVNKIDSSTTNLEGSVISGLGNGSLGNNDLHISINARYDNSAGWFKTIANSSPAWDSYISAADDMAKIRRTIGGTGVISWVDLFQFNNNGNFVATGQLISNVATGTAPISVNSTTPVATMIVAAHSKLYNTSGILQTNLHEVFGAATLSTGTLVVTFSGSAIFANTSYICTGANQTNANAFRIVNTSTSQITITGTGSDVIGFRCVGS